MREAATAFMKGVETTAKRSAVLHPDLREVWVTYRLNETLVSVSFSDDDELVYVVVHVPEAPRRVSHCTIDEARELIGQTFA